MAKDLTVRWPFFFDKQRTPTPCEAPARLNYPGISRHPRTVSLPKADLPRELTALAASSSGVSAKRVGQSATARSEVWPHSSVAEILDELALLLAEHDNGRNKSGGPSYPASPDSRQVPPRLPRQLVDALMACPYTHTRMGGSDSALARRSLPSPELVPGRSLSTSASIYSRELPRISSSHGCTTSLDKAVVSRRSKKSQTSPHTSGHSRQLYRQLGASKACKDSADGSRNPGSHIQHFVLNFSLTSHPDHLVGGMGGLSDSGLVAPDSAEKLLSRLWALRDEKQTGVKVKLYGTDPAGESRPTRPWLSLMNGDFRQIPDQMAGRKILQVSSRPHSWCLYYESGRLAALSLESGTKTDSGYVAVFQDADPSSLLATCHPDEGCFVHGGLGSIRYTLSCSGWTGIVEGDMTEAQKLHPHLSSCQQKARLSTKVSLTLTPKGSLWLVIQESETYSKLLLPSLPKEDRLHQLPSHNSDMLSYIRAARASTIQILQTWLSTYQTALGLCSPSINAERDCTQATIISGHVGEYASATPPWLRSLPPASRDRSAGGLILRISDSAAEASALKLPRIPSLSGLTFSKKFNA